MYALHNKGDQVSRVAVIDFDVHHGNGTQGIIEDRFAQKGVQYIACEIF